MMKKIFPVLILLAILAAACGVKTALIPPDVLVPKAIKDLQGTVKEDTFELTWSVPKANAKGTEPVDLVQFRVLRREETGGCVECPGEFKVVAELDFKNPKGYVLEKNTAIWVDKDLKDGVIYMYKVVSINHWGYPSAPSNEVMIKWPPPPPAPETPTPETPEKQPEVAPAPSSESAPQQPEATPQQQSQPPEATPQSPQTTQPQQPAPATSEGQQE
jgi:hypothetical protein